MKKLLGLGLLTVFCSTVLASDLKKAPQNEPPGARLKQAQAQNAEVCNTAKLEEMKAEKAKILDKKKACKNKAERKAMNREMRALKKKIKKCSKTLGVNNVNKKK